MGHVASDEPSNTWNDLGEEESCQFKLCLDLIWFQYEAIQSVSVEMYIKPNLLQSFNIGKWVQSSADGLEVLGAVMAHATIIVPRILHKLQLLAQDTVCNIHNLTR